MLSRLDLGICDIVLVVGDGPRPTTTPQCLTDTAAAGTNRTGCDVGGADGRKRNRYMPEEGDDILFGSSSKSRAPRASSQQRQVTKKQRLLQSLEMYLEECPDLRDWNKKKNNAENEDCDAWSAFGRGKRSRTAAHATYDNEEDGDGFGEIGENNDEDYLYENSLEDSDSGSGSSSVSTQRRQKVSKTLPKTAMTLEERQALQAWPAYTSATNGRNAVEWLPKMISYNGNERGRPCGNEYPSLFCCKKQDGAWWHAPMDAAARRIAEVASNYCPTCFFKEKGRIKNMAGDYYARNLALKNEAYFPPSRQKVMPKGNKTARPPRAGKETMKRVATRQPPLQPPPLPSMPVPAMPVMLPPALSAAELLPSGLAQDELDEFECAMLTAYNGGSTNYDTNADTNALPPLPAYFW